MNFFRKYGHQYAILDPLEMFNQHKQLSLLKILKIISMENEDNELFHIQHYNCNHSDNINIYNKFKKIYCGHFGIEYMHVENVQERTWIQKNIEKQSDHFQLSKKKQKYILKNLIKSEVFEKFLHTTFTGSKRFSLEGADILIPMLHQIIDYAAHQCSSKIIIGMAHRGRLNVLVNVLEKSINELCYEFSEQYNIYRGTGDAKYHSGLHKLLNINNRSISVEIRPNPSHLEIINPVVMGFSKAYIETLQTNNTNNILPINIHGDAAIIGQGVNQEVLNMSQTNHYSVGGTLHIVINNQIAFTTSSIKDLRSSRYCTDIAKIIQAPVFHVNSDHPNVVFFVLDLALQFKYIFQKDVFIDLVCYRRNGHNESDEPSVTQPIMYKKIKKHFPVCKMYAKYLESKNIIDTHFFNFWKLKYREKINILSKLPVIQKNVFYKKLKDIPNTYISKNINLQNLFIKMHNIPYSFELHNRVYKIYQDRIYRMNKKQFLDWGGAENLAYANILYHGISCRLSGEDVGRGTFFHRHIKIYDQKNGNSYIPVNYLHKLQGKMSVCNSVLSEEGVLAFEYGYSTNSYNTINIWEAQFGDFSNGAQIVIDQFICSGEQKWNLKSKLVMLLPHGYEGQGPEHSSARIERFLQLCAQHNMRICIPSTAAQIYHMLCNQALQKIMKPLIIFTPKSLLRNSMTYSSFMEIKNKYFKKIIDEIDIINITKIKKIIFCSGKIYYDLLNQRRKKEDIRVILIRIEQLYPFPVHEILKVLHFYKNIKNIVWCQEEPKNQGSWYYIHQQFQKLSPFDNYLSYIGRPSSAAPAVGCFSIHKKQQNKIIDDALNII
ncbi:2-oxoglutarate dehydrogenase E1 component [Buchnera aphidicola]|uniref:2-oxoglutarate dehydrogenase E1 component n=1 Tax=Buchnera aphidicola TaxID=9 RepID=UPI003464D08F